MRVLLAVLIAILYVSCLPEAKFECNSDGECPGGLCEDVGFCSTFDGNCEFDRRFSDSASDALAGDCVACPMEGLMLEDGRCYVAVGNDTTWDQAQQGCIDILGNDAHLLHIDDEEENQRLANATNNRDYWIGGNDRQQEGSFVWTDGDAIDFFNWDSGEPDIGGTPDEDCILFDGGNGEWSDEECSDDNDYLCERP